MIALLTLFATGMVGKILQKFVPRTVAVSGVPHRPAVAIKIMDWKVVSRE